jgi:hypothetical protein
MPCICVNPDGTLSEKCLGTCAVKEFKEGNAVQQFTEKERFDKIEYILSSFLTTLNERIKKLEQISMENWVNGFREGFMSGRDY